MTTLNSALVGLASFLKRQGIRYMLIGGLANAQWGRARLTEDIDVTVLVPESGLDSFVRAVEGEYRLLPGDPVRFLKEMRVLPASTTGGIRIDFIIAGLPYEEAAIARAVPIPIEGTDVLVCTPEDLVLHKIASHRARDREDVEGVVLRRGTELDRKYLDPLVKELARGLDRPEIEEFYRACLDRASRPRSDL